MKCRAPSLVDTDVENEIDKEGKLVNVGFIMDRVTDLLNWSVDNSVMFKYLRDPVYDKFDVCLDDKSDTLLNLTVSVIMCL